MKNQTIKKAIIPAAGLGTRFLPATKAQPKEMLPILDKPTLQYIVEEAVASGINEILIITGRNKKSIEDHFDKSVELELQLKTTGKEDLLETIQSISNLADIHYIRQKEALGLGHAIYCARHFIGNEPFAVLLGDDIIDSRTPCLKQLIDMYNDEMDVLLGVQPVPINDVDKYGIIDFKTNKTSSNLYTVLNLIEKPLVNESPSNIAILGRYILPPQIFKILESLPPGKSGEIQLTDALKSLLDMNSKIMAYEFDGVRYDVGDKLGFLKATVDFALKKEDIRENFLDYIYTKVTKR